jgi:ABC-type uncharacterized transport system permease subunit
MNPFFLILPSLCYLAVAALLLRQVHRGINLNKRLSLKWKLFALSLFAIVWHAGALYQNIIQNQGIDFSLAQVSSLIAWWVSLLLLVSNLRNPTDNLGILVFPLAAIASLMPIFFPSVTTIQTLSQFMSLHILLSILSYSMLSLTAAQAILTTIQEKLLRQHHPGNLTRAFPPLQTMEKLLFSHIRLGFYLLSLSLISGLLITHNVMDQHLSHKIFFSTLAWLVFGILFWGHQVQGWRGQRINRWILAGFFFLLISYFGSKLVLEVLQPVFHG